MKIQFDSQVIPPRFVAAVEQNPARLRARLLGAGGDRKVVHDQGYAYQMLAEFVRIEAKLAAMDRKGIDVSVLSPAPLTFTHWAYRDLAVEVTLLVNDGVAEMTAIRRDRLRSMGILPMQHPDTALAELERIAEKYGFRAVESGTGIDGAKLSEARFLPVLKRAAELGVFVLAHPYYIGTKPGAPFDMGDEDPLNTIADAPGLAAQQRSQIDGQTALVILGE